MPPYNVACGCCHRAPGFELTEKEKMGFLTDFHIVDDHSQRNIHSYGYSTLLFSRSPRLKLGACTIEDVIAIGLGAGHCMVACGCCHRAPGFELTEKEKMGFLTDFHIDGYSTLLFSRSPRLKLGACTIEDVIAIGQSLVLGSTVQEEQILAEKPETTRSWSIYNDTQSKLQALDPLSFQQPISLIQRLKLRLCIIVD
jgi:hypothetical protein